LSGDKLREAIRCISGKADQWREEKEITVTGSSWWSFRKRAKEKREDQKELWHQRVPTKRGGGGKLLPGTPPPRPAGVYKTRRTAHKEKSLCNTVVGNGFVERGALGEKENKRLVRGGRKKKI